jgi:hypothetical protein
LEEGRDEISKKRNVVDIIITYTSAARDRDRRGRQLDASERYLMRFTRPRALPFIETLPPLHPTNGKILGFPYSKHAQLVASPSTVGGGINKIINRLRVGKKKKKKKKDMPADMITTYHS